VNPAAALVVAFLLGSEGTPTDAPDYPLGPLRLPRFTSSDQRLVLTDVRYHAAEDETTAQTLSARVRLGTWAFLAAEIDGQRRGLNLQTQRLELGLAGEGQAYDAVAGFRGRHLRIRSDAARRPPGQGKAWVIDTLAAWRLNPDLELLATYLGETDDDTLRPLRTRTVRRISAGALYQWDAVLDLGLSVDRSRIRTEGGDDLDRNHFGVSSSGLVYPVQWDAEAGYEKTSGRFPRSEGFVNVSVLVPIFDHLFAQGTFATSWEPGVERFEQETRAGLTYTARKVNLPRAGEAGRRTVELARKACELGYNERRTFDVDGRRALRERLALSPRRAELQEEIDALYRAQVAERNVLQIGVEIDNTFNHIRGTEGRTYRAFVAVPWPLAWPWSRNEDAVSFLRLNYVHAELDTEPGLTTINREASLEVALNREMSVFFRWSRPGLTTLDVIRSSPRTRTIAVEYLYAFGR
jgi:hypothetical protein